MTRDTFKAKGQPPAEAQPVACSKCGVHQPFQHSPDCGRTPPSTPVGVEAIRQARAIIDHVIHGEPGYELSAAHDLLTTALTQQPAADGGFTAADMMDARQEGRKEAQQSAGFSAGDMAAAAAQGFRDGVASVGPAAVDEAMVRKVAKAINAELEGEENFALAWQRLGSNERRLRDRMARAAIAAIAAQQGGRSDD